MTDLPRPIRSGCCTWCPICECPLDGHGAGACQAVVRVALDRYEPCQCGHTQPALPTEEDA